MSEDRKAFLDRLRTSDELFVLLSLCTRQAYVVCDEETFDDEIFMYFDGEEARAAAKKLADEKTPVTAGRIEGKQLLMFYTSLHTMGINAIVVREGENETLIQLEELVKRIEQPEGKVWVENPSLHLTALYFMQEFRKQPNQQITGQMRQLQEEIAANFEKARFIMAVSTEEKGLPLVKLNNGDVFQPVFTDVLEFQKFNRENKFRPVVIESQKLPQVLAKEAKGVVLNPIGINMPMLLNKRVQGQPQADVQAQPQPQPEAAPENQEM